MIRSRKHFNLSSIQISNSLSHDAINLTFSVSGRYLRRDEKSLHQALKVISLFKQKWQLRNSRKNWRMRFDKYYWDFDFLLFCMSTSCMTLVSHFDYLIVIHTQLPSALSTQLFCLFLTLNRFPLKVVFCSIHKDFMHIFCSLNLTKMNFRLKYIDFLLHLLT
jgi:hypothetical protein